MKLVETSLTQFLVVLLLINVIVLLSEHGILGSRGWDIASILLLASGAFSLRVFAELVYRAIREKNKH